MSCANTLECCPDTVFRDDDAYATPSLSGLSAIIFTVGNAVNETLVCSWDGDLPYTWVKTDGTVAHPAGVFPPGLTFNGGSLYVPRATITGTPTTPGSYSFTITATDAYGEDASQEYEVTVV